MVERRAGLSREVMMEQYVRPGRPVILTDVARGWPALSRWTFDFFRIRYGAETISVSRSSHEDEGTVEMTLAEYLDSFADHREGRPFYLTSWGFREQHPELLDDFRVPECLPQDLIALLPEEVRPDLLWLFIGPAGSGIRMHVDVGFSSAWNVQVVGRKRWVLFPPGQEMYLYGGQVDAFRPDLERFPLYARARPLECVVEPGEMLFVPSLWWHQTLHLEDGIAVTANFADETNYREVLRYLRGHGMDDLLEAFTRVLRERELVA